MTSKNILIIILSFVLGSIFSIYIFNLTSNKSSTKTGFDELPFVPDKVISDYYINEDDKSYFLITSYSRPVDDFIHDLCDNCVLKTIKNGTSELSVWTNPDSQLPISIVVVPSGNYFYTYQYQIDCFDKKTRKPIEFTQDQTSYWLKEVSNW